MKQSLKIKRPKCHEIVNNEEMKLSQCAKKYEKTKKPVC